MKQAIKLDQQAKINLDLQQKVLKLIPIIDLRQWPASLRWKNSNFEQAKHQQHFICIYVFLHSKCLSSSASDFPSETLLILIFFSFAERTLLCITMRSYVLNISRLHLRFYIADFPDSMWNRESDFLIASRFIMNEVVLFAYKLCFVMIKKKLLRVAWLNLEWKCLLLF